MRRVSAGERGLLSCKVQEGDNFIYVNKVGTFGSGLPLEHHIGGQGFQALV